MLMPKRNIFIKYLKYIGYRFIFALVLWDTRVFHINQHKHKKKQSSSIYSSGRILSTDYRAYRLLSIYMFGLNLYILIVWFKLSDSYAVIISTLLFVTMSMISLILFDVTEAEIYFRLFSKEPISKQKRWLIIPFLFYLPVLLILFMLIIAKLQIYML